MVLLMVDMVLFSMLLGGDDVVGSVAGDEGYVVDGISAGVDDVVVICAAARGDDDVDSVLVVEIILTTVLLWRR
jgi:hypothetical protein